MSKELKQVSVKNCLEDLKKVLSETMDSGIEDPALKMGYDAGYAFAMEKVSWYVKNLEKYLEV